MATTDLQISGNITTQNLVPAGVATPGSAVEIDMRPGGFDTLAIQVIGTYTGALSVQGTLDGINWVTLGGNCIYYEAAGTLNSTITTGLNGIFKVDASGFMKLRVTGLAAMTGTAGVIMELTGATGVLAVKGAVTIGAVSPGSSAVQLGKSEDAVAASGDVGVFMLGVRRDAVQIPTSNSGDYSEIALSKYGALLTTPLGHTAKTYRATSGIAVAASATDIAILPGNATNTVQLLRIIITALQTTAGAVEILLTKRSAANTGGTSGAMTPVPMDASDAAAVSVPLSYTANPTPGAAVGNIERSHIAVPAAATATMEPNVREFDFTKYGKPVILSGVAQGLAVNLNGVTVAGGLFNVTFEWLEVA